MGRYLVEDPRRGFVLLQTAENRMDRAGSPLPARPDEEPADEWLLAVRAAHYEPAAAHA
jgi:hypothetical protein